MSLDEKKQELSESAHHTRGVLNYGIESLHELNSVEALAVAREAARDLVLLITDLHPAPSGIDLALTEISTICQHGIVANTRAGSEDG